MPKTKIVCTIGPSSCTPDGIQQLILNGMNVARLNFSHGTWEKHFESINLIRSVSDKLGRPIAILQDLSGQKIRVGEVRQPGIRLEPGKNFILTTEPVEGDEKRVSVSYMNLPAEVGVGDRILLADGLMELVVRNTSQSEIYCDVITGGILTSHKGINLPTMTIKAESITAKDREDLIFGLKNDVDYIALSFVRTADDIVGVKNIIKATKKNTPVIAKIEKHEALENIDEIINACDGIMVARGDLGVEIPLENVPGIQKLLVKKAAAFGKPVIIATQMLRSMVDAIRPTRAEASDVANAVLDGADAIMLSEETAIGSFPAEAVRFMARIAESAERDFPHDSYLKVTSRKEVAESVAYSACVLAAHLDAAAILASTRSGSTAMQISRFKPKSRIIAISPEKTTLRRLSLYWGCIPVLSADTKDTDERIEEVALTAFESGKVSKGDLVVITAGQPVWVTGTTNMIKVKKI